MNFDKYLKIPMFLADEDRNITIKLKYKILDDYIFKYVDKNPIRNPYGRYGKQTKKSV